MEIEFEFMNKQNYASICFQFCRKCLQTNLRRPRDTLRNFNFNRMFYGALKKEQIEIHILK